MFKRILTILLTVVLCISSSLSVFAQSVVNSDDYYSYDIQLIIDTMNFGDFVQKRALYDSNDQIVAYYYEFTNGYLISDKNGITIEYSDSGFPSFKDIPESINIYYIGPFEYYYRDFNGDFAHFSSNQKITSEEFKECSISFKKQINNASNASSISQINIKAASTPEIEAIKLPLPKRYYAYNDDNTKCCSLAALILVYYYSDIKEKCLTNIFFENNSRSFFNALLSYIQLNGSNCPDKSDPNSPYGTSNSLKLGLNAFLDTQNKSDLRLVQGTGLSIYGLARMIIGSAKVPAIICYYPNPSSSNIGHAVFCYGYRYITVNGSEVRNDMIVNDGYGKNECYVDMSYAYSFQYLANS
ncbi:hypothetical protein [Ruminococcus sp. Marseille-P6503]|uniref:hypothetical protein n=1 Tax=Ruminococcus sp. Marseille-P6503 TaxID=2364796 RepID=UPI000F532E1C|nr:hypothetical protein [Ruminococcus sp. Marseille-P6503]